MSDGGDSDDRSVVGDGGGEALATAPDAAVCVGGGRLTEATGKRCLTEATDIIEADGNGGGDGGGEALATAAATADCVGGGRLIEATGKRCLTQATGQGWLTEAVEMIEADGSGGGDGGGSVLWPLLLRLLSVSVEADGRRRLARGV